MPDNEVSKPKKPKIMRVTKWFFKCIDFMYVILEKIWHLITDVNPVTDDEIQAASEVFPAGCIKYDGVRIARGLLLKITPCLHNNRPFVMFHTINLPPKRYPNDTRLPLDQMVHELVHVYQFNIVGSIYMWEALRAQWAWGNGAYKYGNWQGLKEQRNSGKHFSDYGREQQAAIVQYYYKDVVKEGLLDSENMTEASEAYRHFVNEFINAEM